MLKLELITYAIIVFLLVLGVRLQIAWLPPVMSIFGFYLGARLGYVIITSFASNIRGSARK